MARRVTWLVSMTALGAVSSPLLAQQALAVHAAGPTREEVQRAQQSPRPAQAAPTLSVEGGVPRTPCALAEGEFRDVSITLTAAMFDGLKGLPAEALKPAYEAYLGKPQPIAIVCNIRDAADAILSHAGYIAAVRVPPQRIDGGVVHFDVVMAHVVALRVRGDAGRAESLIARYLRPIQDQEAFNAHDAVRYLLLADDLPGYQVRLALKPADGGKPGDVIGEISVTHQLYDVDFNIQDLGSRSVGRFGGLLRANIYGLTGMGDRTTLSVFSTPDFKEQQVVQFGHELRVGGEGVSLAGNFTYAWTRPSGTGLDIRANTLVGNVEAAYPFIRTQTVNLHGEAGIDFIDQDVNIEKQLFTRDHMRIAYLRLDGDATDTASIAGMAGYSQFAPRWHVSGSLELRQGMDILNATRPCGAVRCTLAGSIPPSRVSGDPTPTIVRMSGSAEYRLTPRTTFMLAPRAQYSGHALLSYEQFSGGSYTVGRGFDPGTVLGDSGVGFQAELRYGSTVARSVKSFAFEPYAFVDAAWGWNHDVDPALAGLKRQRLVSVGDGVRAAYGDRIRLDSSLSVPVSRDGSDGSHRVHGVRFLCSLTVRLLP